MGVVMMMGAAVPIIRVMIVAVELLRKVDLAKIEDATKVDIRVFRPLDWSDVVQARKLALCFVELLRRR